MDEVTFNGVLVIMKFISWFNALLLRLCNIIGTSLLPPLFACNNLLVVMGMCQVPVSVYYIRHLVCFNGNGGSTRFLI